MIPESFYLCFFPPQKSRSLIDECFLCLAYLSFLCCELNHTVVSSSLWPQALQPAKPICLWDSPGRNTGGGCQALLQGIFPTQGSNPGFPRYNMILHCQSHQGSPPAHPKLEVSNLIVVLLEPRIFVCQCLVIMWVFENTLLCQISSTLAKPVIYSRVWLPIPCFYFLSWHSINLLLS